MSIEQQQACWFLQDIKYYPKEPTNSLIWGQEQQSRRLQSIHQFEQKVAKKNLSQYQDQYKMWQERMNKNINMAKLKNILKQESLNTESLRKTSEF